MMSINLKKIIIIGRKERRKEGRKEGRKKKKEKKEEREKRKQGRKKESSMNWKDFWAKD